MKAVTIRPARTDDAPRIRELERMIVAASLPAVCELPAGNEFGAAGAVVKDALRLVAIAGGGTGQPEGRTRSAGHVHSDARLVGMIAVNVRSGTPAQPPHAHIRALAVAEPYRRQGIATRLLRHGEAWTRQQGMTKLAANVADGNHAALAFFQRAGYHGERGLLEKELAVDQGKPT